jgi:hypothetical protein
VAGGGALWVSGQTVFGAFDTVSPTECVANIGYAYGEDNIGLNFFAGDFLHDYMNIVNGGFKNVRTNPVVNGLVRADPAADVAGEGFPALHVDRNVFRTEGGISFCDIATALQVDPEGGLEAVYTHVPAVLTSGTNTKVNALRYADPDPVPSQGPVSVFGIPLFFMEQEGTSGPTGSFETARLMLQWLRSQQQRYFDTHPRQSSPDGR